MMMESKLSENIKEGLQEIKAPESLYDFANQVPDLVESMNLESPSNVHSYSWVKKTIFTTLTALACSALFMFGVNQSTSFANYVGKIPVLSQLSEFLKVDMDNGVEKAIDNGFLQDVSKSAEDQGITFTIDHVIADSKRAYVFFHIKFDQSKATIDEVNLINFKITDGGSQPFFGMNDRKDAKLRQRQISLRSVDDNRLTGWLEIVGSDPATSIPSKINLSIHSLVVTKPDKIETILGEWDVSFQRDANKINSKPIEYKGDKFSVKAGSQSLDLKIDYAKVYPMMTEMSINLETKINEGIHYAYHLENENGKVYKQIGDGTLTDSGDVLPQFESSYFEQPQKLFLVIDKVVLSGSLERTEETYEVNKKIELVKSK